MEEPPNQPEPPLPRRDLGRGFWLALVAPIIIFVFALLLLSDRNTSGGDGAVVTLMAALVATVISVITCTVIIVERHGPGPGCLAFFGLILLYAAIAFAGCASLFRL